MPVNVTKVKKAVVTKKVTVAVKKTPLTLDVFGIDGKTNGTITLPKEVFGVAINRNLIAQAVRVHRMNMMQGTSKAKTRGEVTGSGVKIYRQKGTGRARHGDRYAPIFVGGGIAFPPQPRDIKRTLSKTMKKKALISTLSAKIKDHDIIVLDSAVGIKPKTTSLIQTLKNLSCKVKHGELSEKILLTTASSTDNIKLSSRNISRMRFCDAATLSTYDVLYCNKLIITKDAIAPLTKRLTNHE